MTLLVPSRLERYVSAHIRKRGAEYASGAGVFIEMNREDDEPVVAKVTGNEVYQVVLDLQDRALMASCTCIYFSDTLQICKHIWATVLRCANGVQFSGPVDVLIPDETLDFEFDDDDALARAQELIKSLSGRGYVPYVRPPEPSRWRFQIGSVTAGRAAERVQTPPEILWVLDPQASSLDVVIDITSRTRKKNGELGKPQPLKLPYASMSGIVDPADREVLAILSTSHYAFQALDSRRSIHWPMAEYVVPKLVQTGRFWIRVAKGEFVENVAFDDGDPWRLAIRAEEREGRYTLVGSLHRGEERVPVREPLAITTGGFVIFRNRIARFADEGTHAWATLLRRDEVSIPATEITDFIKEVAKAGSAIRIELPPAVTWQERQGTPRAMLEIRPRRWGGVLDAIPTFDYDGLTVSALTRGRALLDEKAKAIVVRDVEEETRKLDALWGQGLVKDYGSLALAEARLATALPKLIEAGWEVRGAEGTYAAPGELDLAVRSGIDWFDLEASVTFGDEKVRLPRLLSALRKGESFIPLSDGRLGLIRPEWRDQLEPFLATAFDEQESGLRFRSNQVLLLDALLAARERISFDDVFEQARRKILDVVVVPEPPPPAFRGTLRPYQSDGLGWFTFLRTLGFGGCLADDMGLGKTIQVLALLEQRRTTPVEDHRPSLVVVPRSVVFNWKHEAARFTPSLRVLDHAAPDRIQATDHFGDYDVVLTTYALLRKEVEAFAGLEFDYVILDEAQAIKNPSSQAAKATTLLRARHRLALSGTPVENHLGELASLFEFLNPGMLRAKSSRVMAILRQAGGKTAEAAEARTMLARTVRPFILRRTKGQVAKELPDRVEQTVYCDLEPKQRKLYDELRDFYRASLLGRVAAKGMNRSKIQILEALLRLRQAACHPGLVDAKRKDETSAKLDKLFEELPILLDEQHKVLVFSQFTSLLAIVEQEMKKQGFRYAYIDGKTRDREAQVRSFQEDPNVPVFLISLKAGGLGLNLTAAEYVFLLDPWWNPAVEAQAIDRAHRIGQTRNVVAYRLVARDTIEEKILLLQQSKKALAEAIISEENSILRQLTTEDLELLLS